jgi:hypothetical protein
MERESTKHGRRLDDELRHETASMLQGAPVVANSRGERRQEDPDEGLDVQGELRPDLPEMSPVSGAEADARAELARAVAGAHFPADRTDLLEAAQRTDADEGVLERLGQLPGDRRFHNVQAIWDALGGHHEQREPEEGQ